MAKKSESARQLFRELDGIVAEVIDQFASQGHGTEVVIETLQDVLAKRRDAYERDPDPAEEDVAEPANDWPGADDRGAASNE